MTLRDLQAEAKQQGSPWAVAKGYRSSAPCSHVVPASVLSPNPVFDLELRVNNEVRQHGSTSMLERDVPTLIAYLSSVFTLRKGDCIFTGTPEGVGRVVAGDRLNARLVSAGMEEVHLSIVIAPMP
jgi:fumarylpyruvate hydrolase